MSTFRFLPATEDDFERLLALRIAAMRPSLERLGRFDPARARQRFRSGFLPAFTRLIVDGDALLGCVTFRPDEDGIWWIEHLYLDPAHQGRGLGAEIMKALLREADLERRIVRLAVLRESDANRFYVRLGFAETHREEWDIYYERAPGA